MNKLNFISLIIDQVNLPISIKAINNHTGVVVSFVIESKIRFKPNHPGIRNGDRFKTISFEYTPPADRYVLSNGIDEATYLTLIDGFKKELHTTSNKLGGFYGYALSQEQDTGSGDHITVPFLEAKIRAGDLIGDGQSVFITDHHFAGGSGRNQASLRTKAKIEALSSTNVEYVKITLGDNSYVIRCDEVVTTTFDGFTSFEDHGGITLGSCGVAHLQILPITTMPVSQFTYK